VDILPSLDTRCQSFGFHAAAARSARHTLRVKQRERERESRRLAPRPAPHRREDGEEKQPEPSAHVGRVHLEVVLQLARVDVAGHLHRTTSPSRPT
jgi:hypothetical protein